MFLVIALEHNKNGLICKARTVSFLYRQQTNLEFRLNSQTESLSIYSINRTFKMHLLPRIHLTPECFRLCFCTPTVKKGIEPIV